MKMNDAWASAGGLESHLVAEFNRVRREVLDECLKAAPSDEVLRAMRGEVVDENTVCSEFEDMVQSFIETEIKQRQPRQRRKRALPNQAVP
jgi:hypothetical protein